MDPRNLVVSTPNVGDGFARLLSGLMSGKFGNPFTLIINDTPPPLMNNILGAFIVRGMF